MSFSLGSTWLAGFSLLCLAACSVDVTVDYAGAENGGTGAASGGSGGSGNHGSGATGSSGGSGGAVVACNGMTCQPVPPSGWQGFAYVAGEANADPAPAGPTCPDGSTPETYFTTPAGPAECTPCSCGGLTGVGCNVPLLCSSSKGCGSPADMTLTSGGCNGKFGTPPASCFLGTPQITSQGSCPASGGQLTAGLPFGQVAHVCVADSPGSCSGGGACVAAGTGQYAGYLCIYQVGEQSCPSEYPTSIVTYKQAVDTRNCGACICTPQVTSCSLPSYEFSHDGLCGLNAANIGATSCSDINVYTTLGFFGWELTKAPSGIGTCDAAGGLAQGAAAGDPAQAITYCCKNP